MFRLVKHNAQKVLECLDSGRVHDRLVMSLVYIRTGSFPHLLGIFNQATTLLLHYAVHVYNGAYLLTLD